jgi:hypothetical protein
MKTMATAQTHSDKHTKPKRSPDTVSVKRYDGKTSKQPPEDRKRP